MNLDTLNEKQKEAVLTTEGPLLIIAGAGSGKTRVLTYRTAYLVEEMQVLPEHIMAITFTNKAAGEMRDRIHNLVNDGAQGIWVATFHASCVRILRRFADRIGYDTNFTIYDADDQKSVMKEVFKRLQIDSKMLKERTVLSEISSAKDKLISDVAYAAQPDLDFRKKKIAAAYSEYQKMLKANNAMDFDDLIVNTVELFLTDKDVLSYYQEKFRYIMVDEYQDTNTAQFELIRLLSGKYRNLCVVGDDDQSIYKFRGANIQNILNFEQHFAHAKVVKLEQNYRSTQTILDAANAVIGNNKGRKKKRLWTNHEGGGKITFRQFDNAYEEAEYVVHDIWQKERKGEASLSDCAILYRTNAQSRLFEERLVNANIPYKIVGGVNFYSRKEIKDILAYLKTIDNAKDNLAVKRIINVPKRGIGQTSLNKVDQYAIEHGLTFYEALRRADEIPSLGKAASKINGFVNLIQVLRARQDFEDFSEFIEHVIDEIGYVEELREEGTEEAKARIENIDELISKAASYEESFAQSEEEDEGTSEAMQEKPTLGGFLEEVALVADIDEVDADGNYVVLMTIHSAKGLEFSQVYLSGMEEGLFPSYMSIAAENPTEELEEERRLCYVAITRAKEALTITSARARMVRGETQFNAVSRFVKEIPEELLTEKVRKTKTEEMPKDEHFFNAKKAFKANPYVQEKKAEPKSFASRMTEQTVLSYKEGDRVLHSKFGEGVVLSIVEGGRDYEVTVDFDTYGVKKMFAMFAKLKRV